MNNPLAITISLKKPINGVYNIDHQCKTKDFEKLTQILKDDLSNLENSIDDNDWLEELINIKLQIKTINFGDDLPLISGALSTLFSLTCQNCLQLMAKKIDLPLNLLLGDSDRESDDFDGYDYWEVIGGNISVHDLIEEILILSVPLYSKHDSGHKCTVFSESRITDNELLNSPFAGLKNQLNNKK